ncbi:hypothetical protein QLZ26_04470 [Cronobacter universalis]|uniref:hypothetical protein n=1 Tax=Cronobacter universalis TaxID=535744 RepID=UPI0024AF3604|nr:hypothetical protein [Cronobacter universalis]MDI7659366.1 hypothetical protein [Cronobacter universalis]
MTAVVILGYFICIKILHAITHALSVLKIKKVYFYLLPCVMALIIVIAYLKMGNILRDTNEVGMDNVSARIGYLSEFFSALADNFLFPGLVHPDLYADNAYIYSWIITGLIGCLLFVIAITLMITLTLLNRSKRKYVLFFSALLLASMTTNIFNIWPIAYLFWAIAGYTLSTSSELSI